MPLRRCKTCDSFLTKDGRCLWCEFQDELQRRLDRERETAEQRRRHDVVELHQDYNGE